jgi:hypothetical protein
VPIFSRKTPYFTPIALIPSTIAVVSSQPQRTSTVKTARSFTSSRLADPAHPLFRLTPKKFFPQLAGNFALFVIIGSIQIGKLDRNSPEIRVRCPTPDRDPGPLATNH